MFMVVGIASYQFGEQRNSTSNKKTIQEEGVFNCPYNINAGIFKDYVISNEAKVVGKPQFIDKPEIIKINIPFNRQEFEKKLYKISPDKGWQSENFDVDGDGKDEIIISANIAMNHTPHIAMVVKNGNIIFEAEGANIVVKSVYGGQGLLLSKTVDWNVGEGKTIRYIYKDNSFVPVWTQKICWVHFN